MKKPFLLLALLFCSLALSMTVKADVVFNSTNFPDSAFRKYLVTLTGVPVNGTFTDAKIATITSIDCSSRSIASLKGVEYFTALTSLNCSRNPLTALDLSKNTTLTKLYCEDIHLTTIDLSKNTALTVLECSYSQFTTLDLSHNTLLTRLICYDNNKLTALDVSHNTALTELVCVNDQLTAIDFSKNPKITSFYGYNNSRKIKVYSYTKSAGGTGYYVPLASLATLIDDAGQAGDPAFDITKVVSGTWGGATLGTACGTQALLLDDAAKAITYQYNTGYTGTSTSWNAYAQDDKTTVTSPNAYFTLKWDTDAADVITGVVFNSTNFPDSAFRKYLVGATGVPVNDIFTNDKIATITSIDCSSKSIASLKGVEFFTALTSLNCSRNPLTALDLSKNTTLTKLYCEDIHLTTIDLSKNTALTVLECSYSQFTTLDLSHNTLLTRLICYDNNKLTALDVSHNTALTELVCVNDQLTAIDFSKNPKITSFYGYNNSRKIKVYSYTKSAGGTGYYVPLASLATLIDDAGQAGDPAFDITKVVSGTWGGATLGTACGTQALLLDDAAKAITYQYNTGYTGTSTSWNAYAQDDNTTVPSPNAYFTLKWDTDAADVITGVVFNSVNFPDSAFRKYLVTLTGVPVNDIFTNDKIATITSIDCSSKSIASLKGVEFFTALTDLDCSYNNLTTLDVSHNTALDWLDCNHNQLSTLDISHNTALTQVNCFDNQLNALDLSNNAFLVNVQCYDNPLTTLDVTKNTALTEIMCYNNNLTTLDVSKNTALTSMECGPNQLITLDVSKNTALTRLDCCDNQLTTLDVSKNTALTTLYCGSNKLTALDVSKNTALTELYFESNHLTAIDLSNNSKLTYFGGYENSRTIKVYSYTRSAANGGGTGYYVPLASLATLIDDAGQADDPAFDITKVVSGTWGGATLGTVSGAQVLLLDADAKAITYQYNTGFTGTCSDWQAYASEDKTTVTAPNAYFTLNWDTNTGDVITGVDGVESNDVSVYTTAGAINIGGSFDGNVDVYNLRGQQVYCGTDSEIAVPAGMYVVKVNGKAHKVLVR